MDLLRIRPVFGSHGDLLELARRRVVADRQTHANCFQVVAQHVFFLGRRAFVDTEQTDVFALRNVVGRTDIGRQHGFLNQAVRHVAGTWHDFFNTPGFVADDLGFGGFKIDCAADAAFLEQRLVNVVQVQQMGHQRLALSRFGTTRIG